MEKSASDSSRYSASELIVRAEQLEVSEEALSSIDERDLSLLVHMGRFLKKERSNRLRNFLRRKKQAYDQTGEPSKTPFALRNLTDPKEREWLLANVICVASVHGCTGGCNWCFQSALLTRDIETVPLEQQKHLWGEILGTERSKLAREPEVIMPYFDNDPLDDPSILEVLEYFRSASGGKKLQISTTIPKWRDDERRGEAAFREILARKAAREGLRVSHVKHRPDVIRDFYADQLTSPGTNHYSLKKDFDDGIVVPAGVEFYKSGAELGSYSPMCRNGVVITPFGVFNLISGAITRAHPNGYLMVPFKGFKREAQIETTNLADLLEHSIALETDYFPYVTGMSASSGICKGPDYTFIYDGENIREIRFDHQTYEILEDCIASKSVKRPKDVKVDHFQSGFDYPKRRVVQSVEFEFSGRTHNVEFIDSLREFVVEAISRGVTVRIVQNEVYDRIKDTLQLPPSVQTASPDAKKADYTAKIHFTHGNECGWGPREESAEVTLGNKSRFFTMDNLLVWLPYDDRTQEALIR